MSAARTDYLKIPKCPSTYQRMMKMITVLKQPPPIFFAPYPAATPRNSLLMTLSPPPKNWSTPTIRSATQMHGAYRCSYEET